MKYFFIVNPHAGTHNIEADLRRALAAYDQRISYQLYVTHDYRDAQEYIRQTRKRESGLLRFIACGGDGTLNKLVNAVYDMDDVEVGCYACGSGNDYVKYYGAVEHFLSLDKLLAARVERVDLMCVNDRVAINMVHFGFDTKVVTKMQHLRRVPLIGGKHAYYTGVFAALLSPIHTACELWVDGEPVGKDKLLLCTLACGQYVGGGYRCAPRSSNSDGLMEICLALPLPRAKLLKLMELYKKGLHLEDPTIKPLIEYRRDSVAYIRMKKETDILLDGELMPFSEGEVSIMPQALPFLVPEGL